MNVEGRRKFSPETLEKFRRQAALMRGRLKEKLAKMTPEERDEFKRQKTARMVEAAARPTGPKSLSPQERANKPVPVTLRFAVAAPKDQTGDYDRIISMFQWSTDKIIELSETEFSRYVLDNWAWTEDFKLSNSYYSNVK